MLKTPSDATFAIVYIWAFVKSYIMCLCNTCMLKTFYTVAHFFCKYDRTDDCDRTACRLLQK